MTQTSASDGSATVNCHCGVRGLLAYGRRAIGLLICSLKMMSGRIVVSVQGC